MITSRKATTTVSAVNGRLIDDPIGATSARWFRNGYRAGMSDVQNIISNGGTVEDVQEWVQNNG